MSILQYDENKIKELNNILYVIEDYNNLEKLFKNLTIIKDLLLQVINQVGVLVGNDKIQSENNKTKISELINILSDNKIKINYYDINTIFTNLDNQPNELFNQEIKNIYGDYNKDIIEFLSIYNTKFNKIKNMIVNIKDIISEYNNIIKDCNDKIIDFNKVLI